MHGVSTRTIRRWTAMGMPRRRDGTYDASSTVDWRVVNRNWTAGVTSYAR